jgi:hypothetical protein
MSWQFPKCEVHCLQGAGVAKKANPGCAGALRGTVVSVMRMCDQVEYLGWLGMLVGAMQACWKVAFIGSAMAGGG